jgi:GntR family transcriptional regulator / MocR family aminotransferase
VRKTWAISGVALHLDLDGKPVRARLESVLREAVSSGLLPPGTALPASRPLAEDLGVARNTVAAAYAQLVAEGWLMARQGSGTVVADSVRAVQPAARSAEPARGPRYDLRPGSPDTSAFPRAGWLAAARRALNTAPAEALGDKGDPRGRPELRQALAVLLARTRGVRANPERILICSGFTQGLDLLCRTLRRRGATGLAIEQFGLQDYHRIAEDAGLRTSPLNVDSFGASTRELDNTDAAAVLLTPAHQFPLGAPLAPARRNQAVAWAAQRDAFVIEDDYDGEFRYDRQPVGAMQALAPDHVIYAGTASKSLAPGLRLGWLVLPPALVEDVVATKALADRQTSTFEQLTLAEFIVSGRYDRHVRRARLAYRQRRDQLVATVTRHDPSLRITGIAAGLHAMLELPAGADEDAVVAEAADHDLALLGLRRFSVAPGAHPPALVVGYGTPPEHAYTAAVARLIATLPAV